MLRDATEPCGELSVPCGSLGRVLVGRLPAFGAPRTTGASDSRSASDIGAAPIDTRGAQPSSARPVVASARPSAASNVLRRVDDRQSQTQATSLAPETAGQPLSAARARSVEPEALARTPAPAAPPSSTSEVRTLPLAPAPQPSRGADSVSRTVVEVASSTPTSAGPAAPAQAAPIQRTAESQTADQPSDDSAAGEQPESPQMDYDQLAEEVYKRIRRQLQVERERQHGVG